MTSSTLEARAVQAGVSRATLARRFAAATGLPPLAYLTRWRMELAKDALERGATLASIARFTGYADEFSFAAAFRREYSRASPPLPDPGPVRGRRAMRAVRTKAACHGSSHRQRHQNQASYRASAATVNSADSKITPA